MKIVEALKRLKVLEKRIQKNCGDITRYASYVSTEKLPYGSEEEQKAEVGKLVQASEDLMTEYLDLKRKIDETNLRVTIEIGGQERALSDWLVLKRRMAALMMQVYESLNTTAAQPRMRQAPVLEGQRPQVVQLYDEREKNENLRRWQDLYDNIDSRLEVVNATTDLVE